MSRRKSFAAAGNTPPPARPCKWLAAATKKAAAVAATTAPQLWLPSSMSTRAPLSCCGLHQCHFMSTGCKSQDPRALMGYGRDSGVCRLLYPSVPKRISSSPPPPAADFIRRGASAPASENKRSKVCRRRRFPGPAAVQLRAVVPGWVLSGDATTPRAVLGGCQIGQPSCGDFMALAAVVQRFLAERPAPVTKLR